VVHRLPGVHRQSSESFLAFPEASVANMCMEFWHEYIARTLQVRRCTAPFSRLMNGTLARSGGRLGGIHTAVVTRGATLSFCSFGHGTASDPVNVTNAVAGAGVHGSLETPLSNGARWDIGGFWRSGWRRALSLKKKPGPTCTCVTRMIVRDADKPHAV
jgi:hypothetical protein